MAECTVVHTRRFHVGPTAGQLHRGVPCSERGAGADNLCNGDARGGPHRTMDQIIADYERDTAG